MKKRPMLLVEKLLLASGLLWIALFAWFLYPSVTGQLPDTWPTVAQILFLGDFVAVNLTGLVAWGVLDKVFGTSAMPNRIEKGAPRFLTEKPHRKTLPAMALLMYGVLILTYALARNALHITVAGVWIANVTILLSFVIVGKWLRRREQSPVPPDRP